MGTVGSLDTANDAVLRTPSHDSASQPTINIQDDDEEKSVALEGGVSEEECETPRRVFWLLCVLYALAFMDRGSLATNAINGHEETEEKEGHGVRGDFEMSNFQNGALSSILMIGRVLGCLAAPYFQRKPPLIVIGAGMSLWTIAALGCGLSFDFHLFAACRLLMGIGQAAVFTLGVVVVDDIAPASGNTTWISMFQAAPGVGAAAGYFYGYLIGNNLTWRYAFYFEAIFVLPLVFLCFVQKKFYIKHGLAANEGKAEAETRPACGENAKRLFSHVIFDLAVIGDSLYTGYLACMEYWTTRAFEAMFSPEGVDMTVGGILLVCGVAGTAIGGKLMDTVFGASVRVSLCISAVSLLASSAIAIPTSLFMHNYVGLVTLFVLLVLILFLPQGPTSAATLWTVPPDLRPLGRSQLVLFNQLFGTIPAPALYGLVVDWVEKSEIESLSHRYALASAGGVLVLASFVFFYATFISPKHPDYRTEN